MELELDDIIASLTAQIGEYARRLAVAEATITSLTKPDESDDD